MRDALEIGRTSAKGSFHLFIGVAVSTTIMAVGTIILGNLLGEDGYGLYGITVIPPAIITLFRDWGVDSAMTKYIAGLKLNDKNDEIYDVVIAGYIFEIIVGLVLLFISILSAPFIATIIFHRSTLAILISITSLSILGGSIFTASQSTFVGFERMKLNSFILICQALVKTTLGPFLVLSGFGILGATLGYAASFILAGLMGIAVVYVRILRKVHIEKKKPRFRQTIRRMLRYGLPLSVSTILSGILAQFLGLMMASSVSNDALLGNYFTAANFATILTFLSVPISTVLFPAFAKLDPEGKRELMSSIFASSVKYTALLLVPSTMALIVLSQPLIGALYLGKYPIAHLFLSLIVITNIFAVFGSLSLGSFLVGLGETRMSMFLSIATVSIGFPLGWMLIPVYSILGMIATSIVSGIPATFLGLLWIWRHYKVRADFRSSARILIASTITAAITSGSLVLIPFDDWIRLLIGATLFLSVYIIMASMIGAITQDDISNLRFMFADLGFVSKIACMLLKAAENTLRLRSEKK
jgi:putative peptidoglycan lipid II flippase